ncbi:hypothetical protein SBRY_20936 [Actinacidiphila bryophytorum]|uniref:Uncharacterized protein n=1 Tax=Actinacidiphila bryophytorum TaxID=1436133 RepID=A0A9W4EA28_9ACTN|nr:hypothetical protein SBRY_20936 [Actinacidiphila bryophytorum]
MGLGRRGVHGRGRGHQGAHPRRRGLPGGGLAAAGDRVHRQRAGRLPGAAHDEPVAVHVPAALRRLRRRRVEPRGAGQGRGRPGDAAPDRGHQAARGDPAGRRRARRGAARRPQGARRAPDAGRPGAQRPGPGVRAGQRRGRRLHVGGALLARDAHRLDRHGAGRRGADRLRRAHRVLPGRHPVGCAQAACHADHRGAGADQARCLRRLHRLPGLRRRLRHGHRHPHRGAARRRRLRPGRCGRRRGLRPGGGGPGVPQQGGGGAAGGRDRQRHERLSLPPGMRGRGGRHARPAPAPRVSR